MPKTIFLHDKKTGQEDGYYIMREASSENRELTLMLYGPDTTHQYITLIFSF